MSSREVDDVSIEIGTVSPPTSAGGATTDRDARGLQPGTLVRHYELIRKVGEGGMGVVFLARDLKLGRLVAMKFVTTRSADAARRFVAEARATAACHHENIVIVHEVDVHFGTPFMVLEYVEGRTLREEVGRKPVPAARVVELMVPVAKALICAHELGIIHRDLKMGNILVSTSGVVKVLDFGVAKVLTEQHSGVRALPGRSARPPSHSMGIDEPTTVFPEGSGSPSSTEPLQVGTPTYMAPEQFATGPIDHRADLFSIGIVMYRMLAGRHPLDNPTNAAVTYAAGDINTPYPPLRSFAPHVPVALAQIVDRCIAKRAAQRFPDARAFLAALEPLLPTRGGRRLDQGESPFPGLSAFQEADADRFFGRDRDTLRAVTRLRERPLIAVVGPSGVGKSSFVSAGVIPALKGAGETWTTVQFRPGRTPLATLAAQLANVMTLSPDFTERLRREPGVLGTVLREHARATRSKVIVFVDQFEELYTLVADPAERQALTAALAGVADDSTAPVRVVLSLRSDFIDRVDEDRRFADELVRGIVLLSPPSREEMREVLTQPLAIVGFTFESDAIIDEMLDVLESTAGALPLLQFTASRLWDGRDVANRTLTRQAYDAIGGVAGALATHADDVVGRLPAAQQRLVQLIFQRLVTHERTRAVVERGELEHLSPNTQDAHKLLDYLAAERLLVIQTRAAEASTVEIVHESLITSWPMLRRWLDETSEDSAFLARLAVTAKQWNDRGRSPGLLWRGDAADEARRWSKRSSHMLGAREDAYMRAVLALADRSARVRRTAVIGTIVFLGLLVLAAGVALVWIRSAERKAADQAEVAREEAIKARAAETKVSEQLELVKAKERERLQAVGVAEAAEVEVGEKREELKETNQKLEKALALANAKSELAAKESATAKKALAEREVLLAKEKARTRELERENKRITKELR